MISPELCIKCKGKLLCGLKTCPILEQQSKQKSIVSAMVGTEFQGATPPGFFVSWQNYPKVAVAPLSALPEEMNGMNDTPEEWYGLPQEDIISFRESLLRSYKSMPVTLASNPSYELMDFQELAMASQKMDVEVSLEKKPTRSSSFDSFVGPMGPTAKLDKIEMTENPKIPKKLDYLSSDTDALSNTALIELFEDGFTVSALSKVLSSGALGVKKRRRIVPTRWSLTATYSNLSKYYINEKVKQQTVIDSFKLFNAKYLDNDFWVLLLPRAWSFEQLEAWIPGGIWNPHATNVEIMADYELNKGLKGYPEETEGAYFAARLAVVEYLVDQKKQAAAIVFREIGEGYKLPLGSWLILETTREAFRKKPLEFSALELALRFIDKKLTISMGQYKKKSKLIDFFKKQKSLFEFS